MTRDELREWLDRRPMRPWHTGRRLDMQPDEAWRDWFAEDGTYLGEVSPRIGPDQVDAKQKCLCEQCRPGRT